MTGSAPRASEAATSRGKTMSELREFALRAPAWLGSGGPESDIVLSSRVRLARNVRGWTFPHTTDADRLCTLRDEVFGAVLKDGPLSTARRLQMEDLEELELGFLRERNLISAHLTRFVLGRGLLVLDDESGGMMVNEEDHVRIQALAPGLDPWGCLGRAAQVASSAERDLEFAFDDRLGYLTACPTNVGTGMRASALMHLPALVLTGDLNRVLRSLQRLDFAVRGRSSSCMPGRWPNASGRPGRHSWTAAAYAWRIASGGRGAD